jgi:hypothetical protein
MYIYVTMYLFMYKFIYIFIYIHIFIYSLLYYIHRSHRWLLLDAGVGEDLILALNCCTDQLEENVRVSTESTYVKEVDYGLINHICLAIGSLAKGSTFKSENQLSLGIPVLCRVLSIFSANPQLFIQTGTTKLLYTPIIYHHPLNT